MRLFFVFACFSIVSPVKAGLNNYTPLFNVGDWLIERKLDLRNENLFCRASVPLHSSWFGSRIRLDLNDQLIVPSWIESKTYSSPRLLERVRNSLNKCRNDFLNLNNLN